LPRLQERGKERLITLDEARLAWGRVQLLQTLHQALSVISLLLQALHKL
jgi:hypothetical protein